MLEIGGYLSFPTYRGKMLYENELLLNSCRNCFEYIIKDKNIKEIYLPYYICDCMFDVCLRNDVKMKKYHINEHFMIKDTIQENSYVLIVNWFGILSKKYLKGLSKRYNLIVDNTHCYFNKPLKNMFTIYSCRKFFGVPDGGVLCGNINRTNYQFLENSFSYDNMSHLVGRFEKTASEFYNKFLENEKRIKSECQKKMSSFTNNLLHSIDYKQVRNKRTKNFKILNKGLGKFNQLKIKNIKGAYVYPFMCNNADDVKEYLLSKKIYIPTLWPNCLEEEKTGIEYKLAKNVLCIPCNQDCEVSDLYKLIKYCKEKIE